MVTYTEDELDEPAKLHADAFVPVMKSTSKLVVKASLWCRKNWLLF